jgi:hypothetical protein
MDYGNTGEVRICPGCEDECYMDVLFRKGKKFIWCDKIQNYGRIELDD